MTKFCGQVNIPTVNNDPIACANFFDTDCVIYQNPIAYFGTNDPSTSTEVFDFIIASLIDARTRLGTVEGAILPTTHADLLGLNNDDHTQYHTDARALTWLGTRSTSDLSEGTNEYFTQARVLSSVLTGLNTGLTGSVTATDSVLDGFGRLQYQIDNFSSVNVVDALSSTSTADALSANQGNRIFNNSLFLEAMLSDVNVFGAQGMANDNSDVATVAPQDITIVKRLDGTYRLVWDNTDVSYFDPSVYVLQTFNSDLGTTYSTFNAYLEDITLEQTIGTREIYTFTTTGSSFIDNVTSSTYGTTVRLRATRYVGGPFVDLTSNQANIGGEKTFTGAFVKVANRLAVGSEPFGGTRLGDAAFQTPEIDTQSVNFKDAGQLTGTAMFVTPVGGSDGYTFTTKNFVDDVLVWSINGVGNATYGGVSREVESTIGLRNDFVGGQFTVLDMFNQDYDAATEVADSAGWVAIHGGGATAKEVGFWRYDTTTYTPIWELSPTNVWTFGVDINVPTEAYGVGWSGSTEAPTKGDLYTKIETLAGGGGGQVDSVVGSTNISVDATDPVNPVVSALNLVTTNTTQNISGQKTFTTRTSFNGAANVTGDLLFTDNSNPSVIRWQNASGDFFAGFASENYLWMRQGRLSWRGSGTTNTGAQFYAPNTGIREYTFPDKTGTVAMLDDINGVFYSNSETLQQTANTGDTLISFKQFTLSQSTVAIGDIIELEGWGTFSGLGADTLKIRVNHSSGQAEEIQKNQATSGNFFFRQRYIQLTATTAKSTFEVRISDSTTLVTENYSKVTNGFFTANNTTNPSNITLEMGNFHTSGTILYEGGTITHTRIN